MSITDLYEPYEFGDGDGPGCGVAEHCDDCVCDVHLGCGPRSSRTYDITRTSLAGRIAAQVTGVAFGSRRSDWLRFFEEYLGIFERAHEAGATLTLGAEAINDIAARFAQKDGQSLGRYGRQQEVRELLQGGLTLTQTADYLSVPLDEIVALLTEGGVSVQRYTTAERLLRAGAESNRSVARQTGLTERIVRNLAANIGVRSRATQRLHDGGVFAVDAVVHEQILAYRFCDSPLSYGEIAKATGTSREQVIGLCRRERARRERAAVPA